MPKMNPADLPSPSEFPLRTDLQMRFNDIDILGHLNNTVYFSFYDTGKAYYLEAIEAAQGGEMNWRRVESVMVNVDCAFMEPVYFGTELEVVTRCESLGERSITLFQMLLDKKTGHIKSVCRSVMVSIDPDTKQSVPLPQKWICGVRAFEPGFVPGPTDPVRPETPDIH